MKNGSSQITFLQCQKWNFLVLLLFWSTNNFVNSFRMRETDNQKNILNRSEMLKNSVQNEVHDNLNEISATYTSDSDTSDDGGYSSSDDEKMGENSFVSTKLKNNKSNLNRSEMLKNSVQNDNLNETNDISATYTSDSDTSDDGGYSSSDDEKMGENSFVSTHSKVTKSSSSSSSDSSSNSGKSSSSTSSDEDIAFVQSSKICDSSSYMSKTLKEVRNESYFGLLGRQGTLDKYEGSSVIVVDNAFYSICDNSWNIMKIGDKLTPFSSENREIRPENPSLDYYKDGPDWETILWDKRTKSFFIVRESPKATKYRPQVHQIQLNADNETYKLVEACDTDVQFPNSSKGIEGGVLLYDRNDDLYILGLCEGNYCETGSKADKKGHGTLILMKKKGSGSSCKWEEQRKVELSSKVDFEDYSDMAMRGDKVLIVGQKDSQLWLGKMEELEKKGDEWIMKDPKKLKFSSGEVFDFPRSYECDKIFCTVEGIDFIDDRLVVAVSDQMKKDYDAACQTKDQSYHVFSLPA